MYIHTSYVHTSVHAIINAYKTNVLLCPSHNTQTGKKTRMRTKWTSGLDREGIIASRSDCSVLLIFSCYCYRWPAVSRCLCYVSMFGTFSSDATVTIPNAQKTLLVLQLVWLLTHHDYSSDYKRITGSALRMPVMMPTVIWWLPFLPEM